MSQSPPRKTTTHCFPGLSEQYLSQDRDSTPEYVFGVLATIIGIAALYLAYLQLRRRGARIYEMAGDYEMAVNYEMAGDYEMAGGYEMGDNYEIAR